MGGDQDKSSLGARLGWALGRAVGTTLRSLREPKAGGEIGSREVAEVGRETREAETTDDEGRKVVLRRTTIDEVEIER
ncbi:MAG: hypothetical protein AAF297_11120 [Planctomycetota bacterium]